MWQEVYEKLMFGNSHTIETMSEAVNIKNEHMPNVLYKYRHISENTLSALQSNVLFSSPPQYFNDLFEGNIRILFPSAIQNFYQKSYDRIRMEHPFLPEHIVTSSEELFEAIAAGFDKTPKEIRSTPIWSIINLLGSALNNQIQLDITTMQQQVRNAYNICCLCSENDNNPMWAHYGDQHKGFCIGYDIKRLQNNITELTLPVLYKDTCYLEISDIDDINGSLTMHMLTLKSQEWSYEKEWRIFFEPKLTPNAEQMPTPCAVYLGALMTPSDETRVYEICQINHIPVFKMVVNQRSQKLEPKPYVPHI